MEILSTIASNKAASQYDGILYTLLFSVLHVFYDFIGLLLDTKTAELIPTMSKALRSESAGHSVKDHVSLFFTHGTRHIEGRMKWLEVEMKLKVFELFLERP